MSVAQLEPVCETGGLLTAMHDCLDDLLAADFARETDDVVLDALRESERLRRRLAALDHQLVGQVETRGLGYTSKARDTAGLLTSMLRIGSAEAHARVRAASECAPRLTMTGEVLAPRSPLVADAQAAGVISAEHARIITSTIAKLPDDASEEYARTVHDTLLGLARVRGPEVLGTAARHALVVADQDGKEPQDDARRNRRRGLTVNPRPDGSAGMSGELNAECSEFLQTYLDAHAAPHPAANGMRDERSAAQRRHDALLDGLKALVRTEDVRSAGGAAVTVLVTMSAESWRTGRGHATTGHGAVLPAAEAIRWAGGDARVMAIAVDHLKSVAAYSSTRRIFTRTQRLAMDARDKGCTFPGCSAPPGWCEAHHVTDYVRTRRTSIDDGALACGYDHRERIDKEGWTTTMINGRPHWVPPPWIDPGRTPLRNTLHDLE